MSEQHVFIPDSRLGMSSSDKNIQLCSVLSNAPNLNRRILKIARDASDSGWEITYMYEPEAKTKTQ